MSLSEYWLIGIALLSLLTPLALSDGRSFLIGFMDSLVDVDNPSSFTNFGVYLSLIIFGVALYMNYIWGFLTYVSTFVPEEGSLLHLCTMHLILGAGFLSYFLIIQILSLTFNYLVCKTFFVFKSVWMHLGEHSHGR